MRARIAELLRKPYLFTAFITLAIVLTLVYYLAGVCRYSVTNGIVTSPCIPPEKIQYFDVSDNGRIALNVRTSGFDGFVCSAGVSDGKMTFMTGKERFYEYCEVLSRYDVVAGENGEVWLHYAEWSENSGAVDGENILKISSDGRRIAQVGGISYNDLDDPPTREPRLTAFSHSGNMLRYAYHDMEKAVFYSIDDNNGTQTVTGIYTPEEGVYVGKVFSLRDGFLLVLSDGRVIRTGYDGSAGEVIYTCTMNINDPEENDFICSAAEMDGKIYVTAGRENDGIYLLEDGELRPAAAFSLDGFESYTVDRMVGAGGKLYLGFDDKIAVYDGNSVSMFGTAFEMPPLNAFISILPLIALISGIIGAILLIAFMILMKKKSLMLKQLFLMIPMVVVICTLICDRAGKEILISYIDTYTKDEIALCDVCAGHIDGESIGDMLESGEFDPAVYAEVRKDLLDDLNYNRSYWSDIYDMHISVPDISGEVMIFADSRKIVIPFTECDPMIDPATVEEEYFDEFTRVTAYQILEQSEEIDINAPEGSMDMIVTAAPVYDRNGDVCAYLVVSTDDFSLVAWQLTIIEILLGAIFPYMIALLLLTTLICVVISLRIKTATAAVIKIADGDFTARIKNNSRDELGEICRQVNHMASNLEIVFDEKDRNEHFYYKFVPEKFCELLGKDRITDLELGDAESREFTVLFCDIRSFSINSEMLTAKENFEFVNIIYGIAGPIIREHGGFVDKYIGDAVMALFESPDDAVMAGIKLYQSIVLDPSTAKKLKVRDINIGIGIHTGMARIGIVGENERLSGTVISDTVNMSSRLESLTKFYHTAMIVSKDTIDRMKDPDSLSKRYIGMVQVAGVNDVTALYEVLDCLGDEEREKRSGNKADFNEAVRLFHLGRRAEAAEQLRKIQSEGRADPVVDMYCEYIGNMSSEDKANVFRFIRK